MTRHRMSSLVCERTVKGVERTTLGSLADRTGMAGWAVGSVTAAKRVSGAEPSSTLIWTVKLGWMTGGVTAVGSVG